MGQNKETSFIGFQLDASLKMAFSNYCHDHHVLKSEVLRQLVESILAGEIVEKK